MGKKHYQPGRTRQSPAAVKPSHRGVAKPIAKPISSGLAAAIAAKRQHPTPSKQHSVSAMASLEQRATEACELEDPTAFACKMVDILRECLAEAGGSVALSVLGSAVRDKAVWRGLQEKGWALGTSKPIHKVVKATWGGWEPFVRTHAPDIMIVDGHLRAAPEPGLDTFAAPDAFGAGAPSMMGVERPRAPISKSDVNDLLRELGEL